MHQSLHLYEVNDDVGEVESKSKLDWLILIQALKALLLYGTMMVELE